MKCAHCSIKKVTKPINVYGLHFRPKNIFFSLQTFNTSNILSINYQVVPCLNVFDGNNILSWRCLNGKLRHL